MNPVRSVRVFWTHGMCSHDWRWAGNRMVLLEAALGGQADELLAGPADTQQPYTIVRSLRSAGGQLDVSFFVWSPLTAAAKAALVFDAPDTVEGGRFPFKRANLNGELKTGLMNDCLTDAVVYSGPAGEPIRTAMREAVCDALGGRNDPSGSCDLESGGAPGPVVIITESLGSKLVFDAVLAIAEGAQAKSPSAKAALSARLAQVGMLFMLANQIPILDIAGTPSSKGVAPAAAGGRSSLADFVRLITEARKTAPPSPAFGGLPAEAAGPFTVVAFTDPNDLLSYRLLREGLGLDARLVNVIVSNTTTYFGYVERPDTAHCGYGHNPYVIGLLMHGFRPDAPLPRGNVTAAGACASQ